MAPNAVGVFWRAGMRNLPSERGYSYGANAWPLIPPHQSAGPFGQPLGTIADTSGTALVSESDGHTAAVLAGCSYAPREVTAQVAGRRHTLGGESAVNVVFCDGHVKWTRVEQTVAPYPNIWTTAWD
jgi:prepilin-type processing-associated H-X9-DG protein